MNLLGAGAEANSDNFKFFLQLFVHMAGSIFKNHSTSQQFSWHSKF